MLKYWSNIFGMIGVAIIGTVVFRHEDWLWGVCLGMELPLFKRTVNKNFFALTKRNFCGSRINAYAAPLQKMQG